MGLILFVLLVVAIVMAVRSASKESDTTTTSMDSVFLRERIDRVEDQLRRLTQQVTALQGRMPGAPGTAPLPAEPQKDPLKGTSKVPGTFESQPRHCQKCQALLGALQLLFPGCSM